MLEKKYPHLTIHTLFDANQILKEFRKNDSSNIFRVPSLPVEAIANYYDAVINITFLDYNYTYTSQLIKLKGQNTQMIRVPNVTIDFAVIDTHTNAKVFGRNENRQGIYMSSSFKGITTRISNKFIDELAKVIDK